MSIEKFAGAYTLTCDNCGHEFPEQFDEFREAVAAKKEYGWRSKKMDGQWEDWCDCCCEEG